MCPAPLSLSLSPVVANPPTPAGHTARLQVRVGTDPPIGSYLAHLSRKKNTISTGAAACASGRWCGPSPWHCRLSAKKNIKKKVPKITPPEPFPRSSSTRFSSSPAGSVFCVCLPAKGETAGPLSRFVELSGSVRSAGGFADRAAVRGARWRSSLACSQASQQEEKHLELHIYGRGSSFCAAVVERATSKAGGAAERRSHCRVR